MILRKFPFIQQYDSQDCGIACLRMIARFYNSSEEIILDNIPDLYLSRSGISFSDLAKCAELLGFKTLFCKISKKEINIAVILPAIFYWNDNHFVVVYKISNNYVYIADPAFGKKRLTKDEFYKHCFRNEGKGYVLMFEKNKDYVKDEFYQRKKNNLIEIIKHFLNDNLSIITFISLTIFLSTIIELIIPFFTQKVIDRGVLSKQLNIVYILLFGQLTLLVSNMLLSFYRSWIFIYIGNKISFNMVTNFLNKLLRLPLKFFSSRNTGDIIERIRDHGRLENFLTHEIVQISFAAFSFLVYSSILIYFDVISFAIIISGSIIQIFWILLFLEKIRYIDYKNFSLQAADENKLFESITTIQDIKLNNLEDDITEQWQNIQLNIFRNNIEKLKTEQRYNCYRFIDYLQNILVTLVCCISMVKNELSIGTYISIMMIIGGLNQPISDIINFILKLKLVKVSSERINDIYIKNDEINTSAVTVLEQDETIECRNLSFSYDGCNNVLKNIDLKIPKGKTTAIVGLSGSGKTTLIKLILKFYQKYSGSIMIGTNNINDINNKLWRSKCGAILQDSAIFSESILYNVTLTRNPNLDFFYESLKLANIYDFVMDLPLRENTIIGELGVDLSQGQKQRILIARDMYKSPDYIFFDEATNSLDAENEKIIMKNIKNHFKGKTIIIVAHRLSTVRDADQIVVLEHGEILEKGTHNQLLTQKGRYFQLVKNQLDLGV